MRVSVWHCTLALALALGACGGGAPAEDIGTVSQASTVVCGAPTNGPVQGVDVSHYQGAFNWASAKAGGTVFGYASIGDGTGSPDADFATNWANMKAAGVLRGAYEYFEPGESPTAQAALMVQAVGMLADGDLPCMIDVETTGGQSGATIAANVRTWLEAVEAGTGRTPFLYTDPGFWGGSVGDTSFGATPLWIADYGPACPTVPTGWDSWFIWQYGDTGGSLDQDVFNGSLAQLTALAQSTPACTNKCAASPRVGVAGAPTGEGYWIADSAGHVYPDGDASFFGDLSGVALAQPVVGIAATPSGQGYWMAAADGGVFSFGNAGFYGSEGGMPLNKPVVGMAAAPDGAGYWLVAADGGIFNFGERRLLRLGRGHDAEQAGRWHGGDPHGEGVLARRGGRRHLRLRRRGVRRVCREHDARRARRGDGRDRHRQGLLAGCRGRRHLLLRRRCVPRLGRGMTLAKPIVGMSATVDDGGYWLVGSDGGIFT